MSIFGKKAPRETVEERFVADLDGAIAGATDEEIRDLADRIFDYIPVVVSQASAPKMLLGEKLKQICLTSGKKLLWHIGSPIEMATALFQAIETHGPTIHRIILQQVERYRRQQAQIGALAAREDRAIDAEVMPTKLLEPVR